MKKMTLVLLAISVSLGVQIFKQRYEISDLVSQIEKQSKELKKLKDINEQYSYHGGDRVLLEVTKRLKEVLRQGDILSRYSGDEFVILIENTNDYDTLIMTESILTSIKKPIKMNKDDISLSVSNSLSLKLFFNVINISFTILIYINIPLL